MNRIKLTQLVKEVLNEMENQVVDGDATLRALQNKVKSGSEVTIEGKPVFKMPMINLATFVGGGRVQLPRDGEELKDVADLILVDGESLELIYKEKPSSIPRSIVKPFDSRAYSDPESKYYRGGD